MSIPPELKPLIAQVRQQYPQLASVPDEVVAQMILEAMQQQQQPVPRDVADLESMSAEECVAYGEQLLNTGQWQEAERFFFAALEKGEKTNDLDGQTKACVALGRLCLQRGDFAQAMRLYGQALVLAERLGDRRLQGVIYDQMGSTYRMQGGYPQAIEYYKKSLQNGYYRDESDLAVGYGNLGNVYQQQGDFERAIQSYKKTLEYSIKLGMEQASAQVYGNLGIVYKNQVATT